MDVISKIKSWVFPIIIIAVAMWSVWPAVRSAFDSLTIGNEDILMVWILNQTIEKIPGNLANIFQGNIFYPYQNVMAYSDLLIPSAFLSSIPVKITAQPLLAYNLTLILGQILTMLVVYLWWKELTGKTWPAVLGSIALGLSQIRLHYFVHLQMWVMQWFLISVWMIWKYRKTEQVKYLFVAGLFFAVQVWESLLPAMWIIFVGAILLYPKINSLRNQIKSVLLIAGMVGILIFPVARVYWKVSNEFGFTRNIREAAHFSMSVEDLGRQFLSPGLFILTGLTLYAIGRKNLKKEKELHWLIPVAILGLIMALGPVLKVNGATFKISDIPIPLPYAITHYVIPGFGAFRTPSRWIWLFAFASSGIISLGFSKLKDNSAKLILPLAFILAIVGGSRILTSIPMPARSEYPEVYKWLKNQEGDAILELPVYTWGDGELHTQELYRMLYSLEHGKNLINGRSGFIPPQRDLLFADLIRHFPSRDLDERLMSLGVDYIIIHKDQYSQSKLQEIEIWGTHKLLREDSKTVVYTL